MKYLSCNAPSPAHDTLCAIQRVNTDVFQWLCTVLTNSELPHHTRPRTAMYQPIYILINNSSGLSVIFCRVCLIAQSMTYAVVYELTSYLLVDRCQQLGGTLVHVHHSTWVCIPKVRNINSDIAFPRRHSHYRLISRTYIYVQSITAPLIFTAVSRGVQKLRLHCAKEPFPGVVFVSTVIPRLTSDPANEFFG